MERVREGIGDKLSLAIQHSTTFVAGLIVGFVKSWQLTLVIASLMPISLLVNAYFGKVESLDRNSNLASLADIGQLDKVRARALRACIGGRSRDTRRHAHHSRTQCRAETDEKVECL